MRIAGREREQAAIRSWLLTARLLTLTGPSGVGKTRLALEVAREAADSYESVAFVELDPLADAALMPPAIATALGVREEPGRPLIESVAASMRAQNLLLVLDHCEHLGDACARLVDALLRACPALTILATSRGALHVPAEIVWPVSPLTLPPGAGA